MSQPDRAQMRSSITGCLQRRHEARPEIVVETLATVGMGFIVQTGAPLSLLRPSVSGGRVYEAVAQDLAERYLNGEPPVLPTIEVYRPQMRQVIDRSLSDHADPVPSDPRVAEALTSASLGSWDENDYRATRSALPHVIVSLFVAGQG